ncbi:hypothetical protein CkaCkLH20_03880 [Colletotrichum karsti]|uniref:Uncharacterized protein n=1 Tax=Colletotrichum karsti TaxID=1095194 RepID=A0A9P6I8N0_9PEZI|nr:uncharacterized protein CkaCkLH20_03880 [Colletotrichum karsti]KAF9878388.1 hypothetical protein CkaCkLH20_03880 [Colletotrichum karsti]
MLFNCRARQQPPPAPPRAHCMYVGCTRHAVKCEQKAKGNRPLQSLYCKDHACRQRTGDLMCPNAKESSMTKFCSDHRRCQSESCSNTRVCADTSQDWPYCQKHTCSLPGCHQKRSAVSQMCVFHTPLCLIPGCGHPRTECGMYCPSHSCRDRDCNDVINGGHWCTDHRVCKAEGCEQMRAVTAGARFEEVCWQHLPTACLKTGCPETVTGGIRFCVQHRCMYPPCREAKDNAQDKTRLYCVSHTCHHASCPQPTSNPSKPSKALYCITHTCTSSACSHPSKPSSAHCALHACLHPSCPSPRTSDPLVVPGAQFCLAHECRVEGCHGPGGASGGNCDAAHSCSIPGCPVPRSTGSPCCVMHATVMAQDAAKTFGVNAPQQPPSSTGATAAGPTYLSQVEETLGQRLRAERERHMEEMRLEENLRPWEAAARACGVGLEIRGRRGRGERVRSCDSGYVGSPSVSDGSNCTYVS